MGGGIAFLSCTLPASHTIRWVSTSMNLQLPQRLPGFPNDSWRIWAVLRATLSIL